MLGFAVEQELIKANPCARVKRLKNDRKKIEIITVEETQSLFPKNWKTVWGDKEIAYVANRLASLTGMRPGRLWGCGGNMSLTIIFMSAGVTGNTATAPRKRKKPGLSP
jgi:hypothetical protein